MWKRVIISHRQKMVKDKTNKKRTSLSLAHTKTLYFFIFSYSFIVSETRLVERATTIKESSRRRTSNHSISSKCSKSCFQWEAASSGVQKDQMWGFAFSRVTSMSCIQKITCYLQQKAENCTRPSLNLNGIIFSLCHKKDSKFMIIEEQYK